MLHSGSLLRGHQITTSALELCSCHPTNAALVCVSLDTNRLCVSFFVWRGGLMVRRRTCDPAVAGSRPRARRCCATTLGNVVHTLLSPSPSSIIGTSESWKVNRHTTRRTSPVSVFLQIYLVSGCGPQKRRSAPPYELRLVEEPLSFVVSGDRYLGAGSTDWRGLLRDG